MSTCHCILVRKRIWIQAQEDLLNLQRSEPIGFSVEEKERARRTSETAEQREERLRKRRMRDRAKRAAKTTEDRAAAQQQRRERQISETERGQAAEDAHHS